MKPTSIKNSIHFFQRKPRDGRNYSLEQIFEDLRVILKKDYSVKTIICPYVSSGVFRRIINTIHAALHQSDINHITGDVNYINLFMRKRKTVLTMLDCEILSRTSGLKKWILSLIWFRIPVYRSGYVTAISEYTKQHLLSVVNCKPDKIRVIYVPIKDHFKRVEKVFNSSNPRILQIGGAHNKNLVGLIEAVKDIKCTLCIIGAINEDNLVRLKSYNITYENYVGLSYERVVEEYELCDLLFFVSTFEGFGMPILEAQTVGRPVITGKNSSLPEVGGDAVYYATASDYPSIEVGIRKIIDDAEYRAELVQKGYENIKRFDPETIAEQYKAIYKELLGK